MKKEEKNQGFLIFVTRGTYGHHDDGYSALLLANALLAFEEQATIVLLGEGVYMAVKGQEPLPLGLPNYLKYLGDFLQLGGRILVLKDSLEYWELQKEKLLDKVGAVGQEGLCREIRNHRSTVTF